jgi:hypothetical protein
MLNNLRTPPVLDFFSFKIVKLFIIRKNLRLGVLLGS